MTIPLNRENLRRVCAQPGGTATFIGSKSHHFLHLLPALGLGGLATDYVTDAVLKSAKTKRWEKVKKVK